MKNQIPSTSVVRTPIGDIFKKSISSCEITGWVYDARALGKIKFLVVRDLSGEIQVTAVKGKVDDVLFSAIDRVSRESVVHVSGKIVDSKQAPGGKELIPESFEVISVSEELPIDVTDHSKTDLPKRLDYRFLDFHRKKTRAIFRIQTEIAHAFREHFFAKGYVELQPPCIISAASEGGTELFPVQYFEQKAYLAQSPQLYKQMLACSMEKVFMITPVWRAEKHNTPRHINEIRQMDIEVAFMNQMQVMHAQEEVVQYVVKQLLARCPEELSLLGIELKIPKGVYLSYEDAIQKAGGRVGEDFTPEQERALCELYPGDLVFTHSWPASIKPFYIMPKDGKKDAKVSEGFDTLYRGVEISSGGQRIHLPELLIERIKMKGLNPENFKSYIDSFRFGAPPHAGWSIGLERITQLICGLDNVKEATMFPRDRDRLTP